MNQFKSGYKLKKIINNFNLLFESKLINFALVLKPN